VTAVTGRPRPSARRILLWRHGQTGWNAEDRFQGHADIDLDDVGRAQVARAARLLARLRPARIVSSDLRRAHHTALALASLTGLEVTCDRRLRETSYSAWEGMTAAEIDERHPGARDAWRAGARSAPAGTASCAPRSARVSPRRCASTWRSSRPGLCWSPPATAGR
jgi:broad specificity phosphatase PhoE